MASNQTSFDPQGKLFLAEIGLNGVLRPVRGVLPITRAAKAHGFSEIYVAHENGREAALVDGIDVFSFSSLEEILNHLEGRAVHSKIPTTIFQENIIQTSVDFSDVQGHEQAKRALEIAAAGNHNVLMYGPPGTGKTMLAKAFPGILPPLTFPEALEVTHIYSIAGEQKITDGLVSTRPIRTPHHTSSPAAIIGGGSRPLPGEVTLAHRGVLFLDEFPEFQRPVLEALREPLEEKSITVARAKGKITFPANIILVAAMNQCPCGNKNHPKKECICRESDIIKYQRKVSGPILDRIDLSLEIPFLEFEKIHGAGDLNTTIEKSKTIRERVITARGIQKNRFKGISCSTNSDMNSREVKEFCKIPQSAEETLKMAVNTLSLSTRSYFRILKIARTIADLSAKENIEDSHILEALQYRPKFEL